MKTKTIQEVECLRCGFKWFPRTEKPKQCPRCKNPKYDKPKPTPKYLEDKP